MKIHQVQSEVSFKYWNYEPIKRELQNQLSPQFFMEGDRHESRPFNYRPRKSSEPLNYSGHCLYSPGFGEGFLQPGRYLYDFE